ncbi:hypothetical protein FXN63_21145 [Pigmentiphaga aceris]|uniref:Uncharacterized protein n=1 Tax=Pigmentiphaga aceris TaxID=1940612 RepID=A0A5C0B0D7_9BURK|nr:hypothetical protein [Pigmentiphaga aceris]QEI08068.1 hypothetical protein FXN63_21145 [Pigmentiphaga aceris]
MPLKSVFRPPIVGAFLAAAAVATVLATVVQTQFNLAQITAMGVDVPVALRLRTTGQDLLGFSRTMAPIALCILLLALPVATWIARRHGHRYLWCSLAGGLGFYAAIAAVDALAPMPTLIAATRGSLGMLSMALAMAVGGAVFAFATRRLGNGVAS